MKKIQDTKLHFGKPAKYKIVVQGIINSDQNEIIGNMSVEVIAEGSVSILEGIVKDQAHLSGILNSIYEIHMPIISINNLEI